MNYLEAHVDILLQPSLVRDDGVDLVLDLLQEVVVLVDLRPLGLTGNISEQSLERAGMTCNKNGVPFDPEKPAVTSGVRLGSPAGTTRGFGTAEFRQVGEMIVEVLRGLAENRDDNQAVETAVRPRVADLCKRFSIYTDL